MTDATRNTLLFAGIAVLILGTGFIQSWNNAIFIFNMGLIWALMSVGLNMQWGYAGLFNVGVMGFVALGGLAAVLMSMAPVPEAWEAGGGRLIGALLFGAAVIVAAAGVVMRMAPGRARAVVLTVLVVGGFIAYRALFDPARSAVEAVDPASTGYLGGLNIWAKPPGVREPDYMILAAWPVGALLAAAAAWVIGKTALGLRSDYLAIATLGIAEIVVSVMKNEDWLARGVKNVIGLPRPVPYEVELQADPAFVERAAGVGLDPVTASTLYSKAGYSLYFTAVLLVVLALAQLALNSPWGRMMRAIRDNEVAAEAMGKDVTRRHLQVFILGSAILGLSGAMLTTLQGQLTPTSYQVLQFTFLVWVMVIVGGSGNNYGAILGGFLIGFLWLQAEPMGRSALELLTAGMADGSALKEHLLDSAAHMRLMTMGVILLVVLRFSPRGLIPEK